LRRTQKRKTLWAIRELFLEMPPPIKEIIDE
jgi:hypothetical protein